MRRSCNGCETPARTPTGRAAHRGIGPATAATLQESGLTADVVPETFVAEGLLAALGNVAGQRFLLPRAEEAREILPRTVRENGGEIDVIPVDRTVPAAERACNSSSHPTRWTR